MNGQEPSSTNEFIFKHILWELKKTIPCGFSILQEENNNHIFKIKNKRSDWKKE